MLTELAEIIDVHGGLAYWNSLEKIDIELSADGFLFTFKRIAPLKHARMTIYTKRPEVVIHDYPSPGLTTHFLGNERVDMINERGDIMQSRSQPRAAFRSLRHLFRWDALDFAYFSSYAMWGYITTPFLFLHEGVELSVDTPQNEGTRLRVSLPEQLPVHCAQQEFEFDHEHRLHRLDYTAEVVGSWAHAAHFCESYRWFGGLFLPTRRRVYPKLLFNKPIKWLTLVAIDIHEVIPHPADTGGL